LFQKWNKVDVYDASGRRAEKTIGSVYWDYIHDLSGNVVTEHGSNCHCFATGYVYFNGSLLAEYWNSTTYFVHHDHLGSTRLMTNLDGSVHDSMDYQPFGEQFAGDGGTTHTFTGKEWDGESGNDYFGARYYASTTGRFMIPDPSPNGIAPGDPQSWNLYSYVRNRPTRSVDVGGNWATDVHAEIVTVALQGLVSAGELKKLVAEQYVMDKNQAPAFQYRHAMSNGQSNPPQSAEEASNKMWDYVATMMAGASATLGPNGQFNSVSLTSLGDAIHTVEDYTSPMHTSGGEPLPWYGAAHGGFQHWQGENSPSDSWAGFGQAVRLTMAAFMQVNPELARKNGLTEATFNAEADRRISQYVENFFRMSGNVMARDDMKEDMARQCALGNPAACDH
jgi:RHS repeat-associated protein